MKMTLIAATAFAAAAMAGAPQASAKDLYYGLTIGGPNGYLQIGSQSGKLAMAMIDPMAAATARCPMIGKCRAASARGRSSAGCGAMVGGISTWSMSASMR